MRTARLAGESVALVLLLASTWLIVGSALQSASAATVSAGRTAFTVLGLAALTWRSVPRRASYRWWQVVLLAGTGVTAYTMLSTVAIALAGAGLTSLIIALIPAVVLIAESVLTRSRPGGRTIAGTGLAVAGAMLYLLPRLSGTVGREVLLGTLCAVGAMLAMAFYGIYFARVNHARQGPMAPRLLPIFALGTLPLTVWATAGLSTGDTVGPAAIGLLAVLGIVVYVPAYLLQHRILLAAGPSYSALLGLATPPLVGISSALLHLTGRPGRAQIAGTALTVCGMALVIVSRDRRPAADAQAGSGSGVGSVPGTLSGSSGPGNGSIGAGGSVSGVSGESSPGSSGTGSVGSIGG